MAKPKKVKAEDLSEGVKTTPTPDAKKPPRNSVTYEIRKAIPTGPPTGFQRTFSLADHGEKFEEAGRKWAEHFHAVEV